MANTDLLISKILNTAPYQLPPILKASGTYLLDIEYLGRKLHKVGLSLDECLDSYFEFVTKTSYEVTRRKLHPMAELPAKLGYDMERQYQ